MSMFCGPAKTSLSYPETMVSTISVHLDRLSDRLCQTDFLWQGGFWYTPIALTVLYLLIWLIRVTTLGHERQREYTVKIGSSIVWDKGGRKRVGDRQKKKDNHKQQHPTSNSNHNIKWQTQAPLGWHLPDWHQHSHNLTPQQRGVFFDSILWNG